MSLLLSDLYGRSTLTKSDKKAGAEAWNTRDGASIIGKRIVLTHMENDPDPIAVGETGTVMSVQVVGTFTHVGVNWDNGRTLSLIMPVDRFEFTGLNG